jgi:hypothetical protein
MFEDLKILNRSEKFSYWLFFGSSALYFLMIISSVYDYFTGPDSLSITGFNDYLCLALIYTLWLTILVQGAKIRRLSKKSAAND